jgi:hypothetical protein
MSKNKLVSILGNGQVRSKEHSILFNSHMICFGYFYLIVYKN